MAVIRRGRVTLDIHDVEIARMGSPGGPMWNMVDNVLKDGVRIARGASPKRSWRMALSIDRNRPVYNAANLQATGRYGASVPYIWYVLEGTTGPITAKNSKFMRLSSINVKKGGANVGYARMVRGQSANDFMTKSIKASLRLHGLQ